MAAPVAVAAAEWAKETLAEVMELAEWAEEVVALPQVEPAVLVLVALAMAISP